MKIDADDDQSVTATLGSSFKRKAYTATVRKNDVVLIGGKGYRIVNIVPRDPKTGVIGWIEINPIALGTEELKDAKSVVESRYTADLP
jgi:hypothetical protein